MTQLVSQHFNLSSLIKPPMGSDAQLAEVSRGDLVFGLRSEIVSRSLCARLQVSMFCSYDFGHPGDHTTHKHKQMQFKQLTTYDILS